MNTVLDDVLCTDLSQVVKQNLKMVALLPGFG